MVSLVLSKYFDEMISKIAKEHLNERFYINFVILVLQSAYAMLMVSLLLLKYFDEIIFETFEELFNCTKLVINLIWFFDSVILFRWDKN